MSLLSELQKFSDTTLPMHMPGGKRRFSSALPYQWDVTDMAATDDLYHPSGMLKDLQDRIAELWKAECSFALVNGSTGGILAAVRATGDGDLLAARNAHRSFYHAAELCRRNLFFVCPAPADGLCGSVTPEQIRSGLEEHPSVTTVFLTSPTYEGVVSDIRSIARICREKQVTLIVDEAHGAHFGFSPLFPESAVTCGADIVVQSLHKTLPALTQTAVLHCRKPFADAVSRELAVFQTSSPSFLLLASADECVRFIREEDPFPAYERRLTDLRGALGGLKAIRLLTGESFFGYDPGKIVLFPRPPFTGPYCADFLRADGRIELEMTAPGFFLAMTSVCDTDELYGRFCRSVARLDERISLEPDVRSSPLPVSCPLPEKVFEPFAARGKKANICSLSQSAGRVSADTVWSYPPGIPLLLPGERIPEDFPSLVRSHLQSGVPLYASSRGLLAGPDDAIRILDV